MRLINKATVLKFIRDQRTTSRIDIAQVTGLNKATVSSIVDELIADQFVHEIGHGSSSGGRKPILLRFNANAGHAIGVDVQLSNISTVICNIRGDITYRHDLAIVLEKGQERQQLMQYVESEIRIAMVEKPASPYGLVGACVALPGMVDFYTGLVRYLPNMPGLTWNMADALSEQIPLPIFCENNANCGAWAEFKSNDEPPTSSLVYINVGIGIGTGIILNGKLLRGRDGIAGEFGHMTINPMGTICACGNTGCWEEYASERSLIRYLQEAGVDPSSFVHDKPLLQQVLKQAHFDNRAYVRAFLTLGQYLGVGIANVLNALNPGQIVLGGSIAEAATYILPEIQRVISHRAVADNKRVPVRIGGSHSVAVGAACLAIDEVLFSSSVGSDQPI